MVVLAASVISKTGKVLVSRQFVDMTRIRIEGLLAAFPKLVGTGKQHTYVETENVRYVYQPMETIYLLLVTNKQSNILEDLETLRLLSKLVPEYCPALDEESVVRMAFELIFAFDEVISLGHKENVTIALVKQYTEMESAEEKAYKAQMVAKIQETKDLMKRKAMEIDKNKAVKDMRTGMSSMSSLTGGPVSMNNGFADIPPPVLNPSAVAFSPDANKARANALGVPSKGMGMQLGKAQKANQFLESLKAEGEVIAEDLPVVAPGGSKTSAAAPIPTDPITIAVEERLVVGWKKDGGLESLEVQGSMSLTVLKEEDAFIRINIDGGADKSFQFKTHPNIDKALYSKENILGLKDPSRPFPTGSPLGILKWRMQSRDESLVPISINCWPSASGGDTYVNIEYESSDAFDLQNVVITIPLPALREGPTLKEYDGEPRFDSRRSVLEWNIVLIDKSNRSGSMEFVVPAADPNVFFPIDCSFTTAKTFCDVRVTNVVESASGKSVKFASRTQMVVDSYQIA